MKHILKTEADWLAIRKDYITASEASVLVGADPYSSPKAIKEPSTFTGNAYTFVGQMLEPVVVMITNQVLGTNFVLYEQEANIKEFYTAGHFGATPDAHQDRRILLECKTVNSRSYLKYSSVVPSKYVIQNLIQQICVDDLEDYGYISLMDTKIKSIAQYEQLLKEPDLNQDWKVSVFKIWKDDRLCSILLEQADRYKECESKNKQFRVDSKIKQMVKIILPTICEKIV